MDVYRPVYEQHRIEERRIGRLYVIEQVARGALVGGMCAVCLGSLVVPLFIRGYPLAIQEHLAWIGSAAAGIWSMAKVRRS